MPVNTNKTCRSQSDEPDPSSRNWMSPSDFEQELDIPEATQAVWRSTGRNGLPYYKVGRLIRYKRSEIEQWLATHAAHSLKS